MATPEGWAALLPDHVAQVQAPVQAGLHSDALSVLSVPLQKKLEDWCVNLDNSMISFPALPKPRRNNPDDQQLYDRELGHVPAMVKQVNGVRQAAAKRARDRNRQTAAQVKIANQLRNCEGYCKRVADIKGKAAPQLDCTPGRCVCPRDCCCEHSSAAKIREGSDAAEKLATRFHASTNVVFSMELPDDVLRERIQTCKRVSDEHKALLATEWASKRAAHGMPMPACASLSLASIPPTKLRRPICAACSIRQRSPFLWEAGFDPDTHLWDSERVRRIAAEMVKAKGASPSSRGALKRKAEAPCEACCDSDAD